MHTNTHFYIDGMHIRNLLNIKKKKRLKITSRDGNCVKQKEKEEKKIFNKFVYAVTVFKRLNFIFFYSLYV